MSRFIHVLIVALGSVICATAQAEPYFAVQQGLKCVACHVNPTGGGLRNAFGNTWGQTVLPQRTLAVEGLDAWSGEVVRRIRLGANLRASATYDDVPNQQSLSEFDVDESRLYLDLAVLPERLGLYVDQRLAPGGSTNLETYARLALADGRYYVKAGQMYLPYGWRLEDDTAFIRQVPGINFATPDKGLEVGLETTHWTAQLAVSNGTAGGSEQDSGKQWSVRAEHVRAAWRIGASFNFNDAEAGERRMQNVFAGLRTGPVSWLAEADYVVDDGFVGGRREQWVGLIEANWGIFAGHNLKLTAEYFDPDDAIDEDEQNRLSAVWEWTPMQFLQLRVGLRVYDGIPQNDLQNRRSAFAQLNGYF